MIPRDQTIIIVEHELKAVNAWADRYNIPFTWIPGELELRVVLTQPQSLLQFFLTGKFPDYKELPPIWNFCSSEWKSSSSKEVFPKPQPAENIPGSIFIAHGNGAVICAPFSRLAFAGNQGPHADWPDLAQWQTYAPEHTHATTIGDMLNIIKMHFFATKGRMSDVG